MRTHWPVCFEIKGSKSGKVVYRGQKPACGADTPSYGGFDNRPGFVDCENCRRTKAFKEVEAEGKKST